MVPKRPDPWGRGVRGGLGVRGDAAPGARGQRGEARFFFSRSEREKHRAASGGSGGRRWGVKTGFGDFYLFIF